MSHVSCPTAMSSAALPNDSPPGNFTLGQYLSLLNSSHEGDCSSTSVETHQGSQEGQADDGASWSVHADGTDVADGDSFTKEKATIKGATSPSLAPALAPASAAPSAGLSALSDDELHELCGFLALRDLCRLLGTCRRQRSRRGGLLRRISELSVFSDMHGFDGLTYPLMAAPTLCGGQDRNSRGMLTSEEVQLQVLARCQGGIRSGGGALGLGFSSEMNMERILAGAMALRASREQLWTGLSKLRDLNLGPLANKDFLSVIAGEPLEHRIEAQIQEGARRRNPTGETRGFLLSCLEKLSVAGSVSVDNASLLSLGNRPALRELDVTFCSRVTYGLVVDMREALPACLVRRLPAWICGVTATPFMDDDGNPEAHMYWPDGTFSYTRTKQSEGFVVTCRQLSSKGYVANKLQFVDFDPPPTWPGWTAFAYRPVIALFPTGRVRDHCQDGKMGECDNEGGDGDLSGWSTTKLVVQGRGGLRQPETIKVSRKYLVSMAERLQLGESTMERAEANQDGNLDGTCFSRVEDEDTTERGVLMFSHMMSKALPDSSRLPPLEIVKRNADFLDEMDRVMEQLVVDDDIPSIASDSDRDSAIADIEEMLHNALLHGQ